jgi:GTP cyclohydrolase I
MSDTPTRATRSDAPGHTNGHVAVGRLATDLPELDLVVHELLLGIGEDPSRPGLRDTPSRVARSMRFLTQGYGQDPRQVVGRALFRESCSEPVVVRDIELYSLCEHHMLPFWGKAHIAYLPADHVIGLSKLPRLVDVYARRLQVQERLTRQIAEAIRDVAGARGVGVVIEASHMCVMMRGVQRQGAATVTSCFLDAMQGDEVTRSLLLNATRG